MDYDNYRRKLLHGYYSDQLAGFYSRFKPREKIVILLPGGMGSWLNRTEYPFPESINHFGFPTWLDTALSGKVDFLRINDDGVDYQSHVVAPFSSLAFMGISPYAEFFNFVSTENWNLLVFGFDWRRSIDDNAIYLKAAIADLQTEIRRSCGYDPLPDITIVTHSLGGLLLAYTLHDAAFAQLPFAGFLTIAANFYGWPSQMIKFYEGQAILNWFGVSDAKVTEIIGSLPGSFALMPLPMDVYQQYGSIIGLARYPIRDQADQRLAVDPYDSHLLNRWPAWMKTKLIDPGSQILRVVANPFPAGVSARFANVRSALDSTTVSELFWSSNAAQCQPGQPDWGQPSPGGGDGVIPAWSAFHAETANYYDLQCASDHVFLLGDREVQHVVKYFVEKGKLPKQGSISCVRSEFDLASKEETKAAVVEAVQALRDGRPLPDNIRRPRNARGVLRQIMS